MAHARIEKTVLDSGLTVLAVESRSVPVFAAVLALDAGSRFDPAGRPGLACLTASLLSEGTASLSGDAMAQRLDALGASLDASCAYETASLTAVGLAAHMREILGIVADAVSSPRIDPTAFEDVRRRQLTGISEDDDDPYCVCRREFFGLVFEGHPRGLPLEGRPESVRGLTDADARAFHTLRYGPRGAVLGLSGDFDAREAVDAAGSAFASWTREVRDAVAPPPIRRRTGVRTRAVEMDREQTHVSLGSLGLSRTDPDYYAVSVLDVVLGDSPGLASRLAARLRETEGLAYIVESDTVSTAGRDPGAFWAYTATSPERTPRAVRCILEEMRRIRSEPPSQEEVSAAIAYLSGRHALDRETCEARAARLVGIERFGLGLDYEERYPSIVGSVTREAVHAAAQRVVDPDNYSLVVVGRSASRSV